MPSRITRRSIAFVLHASLGCMLTLAFLSACEPENNTPPDQPGEPVDSLLYNGLPGLQDRVFQPTCANAGCHDGTFEPDFRTLGSTHATLVNQPVIKNDSLGSFGFRVVPGDTAASQLLARLTYDIDGNSGIMPLVIDPGSDYERNRELYISWVKRWILEGAKIQN